MRHELHFSLSEETPLENGSLPTPSSRNLSVGLTVLFLTFSVTSTEGEGYVDSGVKILIAVVIGALLLGGLYALFNTTIMPTVTSKITELFNFAG